MNRYPLSDDPTEIDPIKTALMVIGGVTVAASATYLGGRLLALRKARKAQAVVFYEACKLLSWVTEEGLELPKEEFVEQYSERFTFLQLMLRPTMSND